LTDTITLLLALLTPLAQGAALVLWAAIALRGRHGRAGSIGVAIRDSLAGSELLLALVVVCVATAGSLFFSEAAGYPPCPFCWYQRICMYPLVPILALAAWRHDLNVAPYALLLCGAGAGLSIYHYQLERFPAQGGACSADVPCTVTWVWELGYISIPLMALTAFVLTGALLSLGWIRERDAGKAEDRQEVLG
jgi:disulfide bond formation protein DsbB